MNAGWIVPALAGLALTAQDPAPVTPAREPQARRSIAGLAGLHIESKLVYTRAQRPERSLSATYSFPERVRWSLLDEGAAADARDLYYRFGERYHALSSGRTRSRELASVESPFVPLHMELRRALWLWPDGFEWREQAGTRSAELTLVAPGCETSRWTLTAQLDSDGRPRELRVEDPSDASFSERAPSLRAVTWEQRGARAFPSGLELFHGEEVVWSERVERVETRVNMLDHFFLPPDRKAGSAPTGFEPAQTVLLPPSVVRRVPLDVRDDWEAQLAECARLRAVAVAELAGEGLELRDELALELDAHGRPAACLLRLAGSAAQVPAGWARVERREGVSFGSRGRGPVSAATLAALRRGLPRGSRPGAAYVRVAHGPDGEPTCQVLQPFQRPE